MRRRVDVKVKKLRISHQISCVKNFILLISLYVNYSYKRFNIRVLACERLAVVYTQTLGYTHTQESE